MSTVCVYCSSSNAIDDAYPRDEARGFDVGALRGAFTVEIDLDAD